MTAPAADQELSSDQNGLGMIHEEGQLIRIWKKNNVTCTMRTSILLRNSGLQVKENSACCISAIPCSETKLYSHRDVQNMNVTEQSELASA